MYNDNIFREYDIRGVYGVDFDLNFAYKFGKAFGSYIKKDGKDTCIVGHDNRLSSKDITNCLINGILSSGVNIIYLGLCTTPIFYYACILKEIYQGVMVTASHNPKEDNGFKFCFNSNGNAKGEEIILFKEFLDKGKFTTGFGIIKSLDVKDKYYNLLINSTDINKDKRLKVIIDCGNGTTSDFVRNIYDRTLMDITYIYADSDGNFPNHHPDPAVEENLTLLKKKVLEINADIGISFDGDGDRVGFIDNKGNFITADKFMAVMSNYLLPNSDNKRVLYDVKCSKSLIDVINNNNGTPIISRTGNSYTKYNTRINDCLLGGEFSGHIYFRDKFLGFDSGMYAGLRMIELLTHTDKSFNDLINLLPFYYSSSEIKVKSDDVKKKIVVQKVIDYCKKKGYNSILIDGIRCEFSDGWALIRYSNTGPNLTLRFEASTKERLEEISNEFIDIVNEYNK